MAARSPGESRIVRCLVRTRVSLPWLMTRPRSAGDRVERGAAPLSTQGSRGARLLERGSQRGVPFGLRCRSRRALTREFHRGARPPLGRGARGGTPLPSRAGIEAGPSPPERAAHYRAWLAFLHNGTSSYRCLKSTLQYIGSHLNRREGRAATFRTGNMLG